LNKDTYSEFSDKLLPGEAHIRSDVTTNYVIQLD